MPEAARRLEAEAASIIGHLATHLDNLSSSDKWQATGNRQQYQQQQQRAETTRAMVPTPWCLITSICNAETCVRFDSLMRNKIDWLTATTMEPQPEFGVRVEVPSSGSSADITQFETTQANTRDWRPRDVGCGSGCCCYINDVCLPASANEDVAWGHATSSGQPVSVRDRSRCARTIDWRAW